MSELAFEVGILRTVYSGATHARLVPLTESYDRMTVRPLRKLVVYHDEDGNVVAERKEVIRAGGTNDQGARVLLLTVLGSESVIVTPHIAELHPRGLVLSDARACGHRTVLETCDHWNGRHPRQDVANLVWFALGDLRDRDLYLQWSGRGGGDYTYNRHRSLDAEAPALTPEQYDSLGVAARQTSTRRRVDALGGTANESLEKRIERLESLPERIREEVRQELRIIGQRVARSEKRKPV